MVEHTKILLQNIEHEDQYILREYEARGGYKAIKKALQMKPDEVTQEVMDSNMRGRGGAGFPTGKKWSFVPKGGDKPVYLIHNADESEPGTFKDRVLLERNPHLCLEGMLIAAWALQSELSIIYIRGEYAFAADRLSHAIKEAERFGYLGENIFGSKFSHRIILHRGAGAYVCGEETALIESLEGKRGQPRLKPPFYPAVRGLYDCPTVVNNTETLANLPWIITNGGEAFAKIGPSHSTGTKLISASGHLNKPGVYEVDMGYSLLDFIENECGGIREGRAIKAVIPGGSSVNVLRGDELEGLTLDYESLGNAGSSLGCAGFMVLDETTDMLEAVYNLMRFYAHESCGKCTPCREGGHWIQKILGRVRSGRGVPGDAALILNICDQIEGHTICAFGDTMVLPCRSIIEKFPDEIQGAIDATLRGVEVPAAVV